MTDERDAQDANSKCLRRCHAVEKNQRVTDTMMRTFLVFPAELVIKRVLLDPDSSLIRVELFDSAFLVLLFIRIFTIFPNLYFQFQIVFNPNTLSRAPSDGSAWINPWISKN